MESIAEYILISSFHGSLAILAILLLRPLLKKGPKQFLCLLWLLAFVRLLLPFQLHSSFSLQPDPVILTEIQQEEVAVIPSESVPDVFEDAVPNEEGIPQIEENLPEHISGDKSENSGKSISMLPLFGWIWLVGAALFLFFSIYSYCRLRLAVRDAIWVGDAWESEHIETAFILGFLRPRIYIPMGMDDNTRQYILIHEETHLDKGDQWLKISGYLTLALHWFNPLVWIAYSLLCKDIELACDERVVAHMDLTERKAYSKALLTCSANHIHLSACPVAFGEVSVKERIKAVLKYKKPALWLTILSAVTLIFIAVCFVTSPEEKSMEAPELSASAPAKEGPVADLSVSEIQDTCEQSIEELVLRKGLNLREHTVIKSDSRHYASGTYLIEYLSYGEDYLYHHIPVKEEDQSFGVLSQGDVQAVLGNQGWLRQDSVPVWTPDAFLSQYSPKGKQISFPEGTGVLDPYTLSCQAQWEVDGHSCSGTLTYQFAEDGTLQQIQRKFTFSDEEGKAVQYQNILMVVPKYFSEIEEQIEATARFSVNPKQLEERELHAQQPTDIPSNFTPYDLDYMLGSDHMKWELLNSCWTLDFGVRNQTPVSADLVFLISQANQDSGIQGSVAIGDHYYLEKLENNKWIQYSPLSDGKNVLTPVNIEKGTRIHLNWEDSYGALPGGYYRIGAYYTLDAGDQGSDQKFAYAKFRIFELEVWDNINFCREGIKNLLAEENYHLTVHDVHRGNNRPEQNFFMHSDIWKHGGDYLRLISSYELKDHKFRFVNGSSIVDGVAYLLEYEGEDFSQLLSREPTDYAGNMELGTLFYDFSDGPVRDAVRNGNQITVDCDSRIVRGTDHSEILFSFDSSGKLQSIQRISVTADGDRCVEGEVTVHKDSPEEISRTIQDANAGKSVNIKSYSEK